MWFIWVAPVQFGGPEKRYIALDGTVSNSPKLAAKFSTSRAAYWFAQEKRIKLDGATRYIDQKEFHDSDVDIVDGAELRFSNRPRPAEMTTLFRMLSSFIISLTLFWRRHS